MTLHSYRISNTLFAPIRMLLILFTLLIAIPSTTFAQPPDTLWTRTWDNPEDGEHVFSVRPTHDGGLILAGATDHGPGLNNAWIMRTDANGDEIWSQLNSGGFNDAADHIEQTSDGGFIECGETWSYSPYDDWDAYVRKLDADGNQIWARLLGADGSFDYALCVREVPSGGYVCFARIDFEMTVVRLGLNGGILWERSFPSEFTDEPNFIEPTRDGGFLLACNYYNETFLLAKLNADGTLAWNNSYGEPDGTAAECVRELPDGTFLACGSIHPGPPQYHEWYVLRGDADGNLIWQVVNEAILSQTAEELWLTPDGNFVVAGWAQDEDYSVEYWLKKYDLDGNELWHLEIEGGIARSMCQTKDGGYVFGGDLRPDLIEPSSSFHIIKAEPEVEIALQTWTPVIPETGGWLRYGAQVSNILVDPPPMDAWLVVTGPNGARTPLNNFPITLQPGATWTRPQINVHIPGDYPNGEYLYEIHLGNATAVLPPGHGGSRNMAVESFTFTKGGE